MWTWCFTCVLCRWRTMQPGNRWRLLLWKGGAAQYWLTTIDSKNGLQPWFPELDFYFGLPNWLSHHWFSCRITIISAIMTWDVMLFIVKNFHADFRCCALELKKRGGQPTVSSWLAWMNVMHLVNNLETSCAMFSNSNAKYFIVRCNHNN